MLILNCIFNFLHGGVDFVNGSNTANIQYQCQPAKRHSKGVLLAIRNMLHVSGKLRELAIFGCDNDGRA